MADGGRNGSVAAALAAAGLKSEARDAEYEEMDVEEAKQGRWETIKPYITTKQGAKAGADKAWIALSKKHHRKRRLGMILGCVAGTIILIFLVLFLLLLLLKNIKMDPLVMRVHSVCGKTNEFDLSTTLHNPCPIYSKTAATTVYFSDDGEEFLSIEMPGLELHPSADIDIQWRSSFTITNEDVAARIMNGYFNKVQQNLTYSADIALSALGSTIHTTLEGFTLLPKNVSESEQPSPFNVTAIEIVNNTQDNMRIDVALTYNHSNEQFSALIAPLVVQFVNQTSGKMIAESFTPQIDMRFGILPAVVRAFFYRNDLIAVRDAANSFLNDKSVPVYVTGSKTQNQGCLLQRLMSKVNVATDLSGKEDASTASPSQYDERADDTPTERRRHVEPPVDPTAEETLDIKLIRLLESDDAGVAVEVDFLLNGMTLIGNLPDVEMHIRNMHTGVQLAVLYAVVELDPINRIFINATTLRSALMERGIADAIQTVSGGSGSDEGLHLTLHGAPLVSGTASQISMFSAIVSEMSWSFAVSDAAAAADPNEDAAVAIRHVELLGADITNTSWVKFRLDVKLDFAQMTGQLPAFNFAIDNNYGPIVLLRSYPFALAPFPSSQRTYSQKGADHLGFGKTLISDVSHSLYFDIMVVNSELLVNSVNDAFDGAPIEIAVYGDNSTMRSPIAGQPVFGDGHVLQRVLNYYRLQWAMSTANQSAEGASSVGNGGVMPEVDMGLLQTSTGLLTGAVWMSMDLPLDDMSIYVGDLSAIITYTNEDVVRGSIKDVFLQGKTPVVINVTLTLDASTPGRKNAIEDFMTTYIFGTRDIVASASGSLQVRNPTDTTGVNLEYGFTLPKSPGGDSIDVIACIEQTRFEYSITEILLGNCDLQIDVRAYIYNPLPWFAMGANFLTYELYFDDKDGYSFLYGPKDNIYFATVVEGVGADPFNPLETVVENPLPIVIPANATIPTVMRINTAKDDAGSQLCIRLYDEFELKNQLVMDIRAGRTTLALKATPTSDEFNIDLYFEMPDLEMKQSVPGALTCAEELGFDSQQKRDLGRSLRFGPHTGRS